MTEEQQPAEAAPEESPIASAEPARTDVIVDAWRSEFLHNSPVAQSTEAWNHVTAALEVLKSRLKGE